MPKHKHSPFTSSIGQILASKLGESATGRGGVDVNSGNPNYEYTDINVGGSQPHNNMPPYLAVTAWKRIE